MRRLADSDVVAELGERDKILELQRKAGNRAVVAALGIAAAGPAKGILQRISWDDVIDAVQWTNPITFSQKAIRHFTGVEANPFFAAEQAVKLSASRIAIPWSHYATAGKYAAANADDGKVLRVEPGDDHRAGHRRRADQRDGEQPPRARCLRARKALQGLESNQFLGAYSS